jgi:hypothetical protein
MGSVLGRHRRFRVPRLDVHPQRHVVRPYSAFGLAHEVQDLMTVALRTACLVDDEGASAEHGYGNGSHE